jgi:hypothetical protein
MTLYVPGLLASNASDRPSLGQLLNTPLVGSAETLRLQLSVSRGRGKSLSLNHVRQIATDLLGLRDDVSTLEITAMESDDAPREPIDLLQARLEADIPIQRTGRRYGRDERWAALRQTFAVWSSNGQLA